MTEIKKQHKKNKPYLYGRLKCIPENEVKRFFMKIKKTKSCWIWKSKKTPKGYGTFDTKPYGGGTVYAHRYSYKHHFGNFDKNLFVCHKCDNPSCVNPKHLFLGTCKDNVIDCFKKGRGNINLAKYQRSKTHCPKGHEYNEENTAFYVKDYRSCRQCNRDRSLRKHYLSKSS